MAKKKSKGEWQNRIVKYGEIELEHALANPLNWRVHPYEQSEVLDGVLDEVGIVQNVLVNLRLGEEWPDGQRGVETFIDGHLRAARGLSHGQKFWPATYVDLKPNEEHLVLLALDRIGAMAREDETNLQRLFESVLAEDKRVVEFLQDFADDFGMMFGGEKKQIVDKPPKLDQAKALMAKWDVQEGDLWQLGQHRLICGDSADAGTVRRLLEVDGAMVQGRLMSTDPPYMVDYYGDQRPGGGKDWRELYQESNISDKFQFLVDVFEQWIPYLDPHAAWFVWHAVKTQAAFELALTKCDIFVHQQIIWSKPVAVMSYSKYYYRHEPCFFGWKHGNIPHMRQAFFGGKNNTVWQEWFDASRGLDEILLFVEESGTLWAVDFFGKKRPSKNLHPTEKPLELFARPMRNHTQQGDICFEPFSGSGSQILAGEKTGRVVYGCDRQPAFVAVAIERWHEATGEQPVLLSRGHSIDNNKFFDATGQVPLLEQTFAVGDPADEQLV